MVHLVSTFDPSYVSSIVASWTSRHRYQGPVTFSCDWSSLSNMHHIIQRSHNIRHKVSCDPPVRCWWHQVSRGLRQAPRCEGYLIESFSEPCFPAGINRRIRHRKHVCRGKTVFVTFNPFGISSIDSYFTAVTTFGVGPWLGSIFAEQYLVARCGSHDGHREQNKQNQEIISNCPTFDRTFGRYLALPTR